MRYCRSRFKFRRNGAPSQHARNVVEQEPPLLRTREEYLPSNRSISPCVARVRRSVCRASMRSQLWMSFSRAGVQKSRIFPQCLFHGNGPGGTSLCAEANAAQPGVLGKSVQEAQEQFFVFTPFSLPAQEFAEPGKPGNAVRSQIVPGEREAPAPPV